ncbi:MAG: hypothetical protein HGA19_07990 [Oscillochloris sp.]|nr:hypothetical protein [Oscillochloris sp.]
MDLFAVDDQEQLFISPDIDDWQPILSRGITVVFDLDDCLDIGVPIVPNQIIYVYFPFEDKRALPDLPRLHALSQLGASLIAQGNRVLVHCGMGHNRSALLAGMILIYSGWTGPDAVVRLRERRMGALYNTHFAEFLQQLPSLICRDTGGLPQPILSDHTWPIPEMVRMPTVSAS